MLSCQNKKQSFCLTLCWFALVSLQFYGGRSEESFTPFLFYTYSVVIYFENPVFFQDMFVWSLNYFKSQCLLSILQHFCFWFVSCYSYYCFELYLDPHIWETYSCCRDLSKTCSSLYLRRKVYQHRTSLSYLGCLRCIAIKDSSHFLALSFCFEK